MRPLRDRQIYLKSNQPKIKEAVAEALEAEQKLAQNPTFRTWEDELKNEHLFKENIKSEPKSRSKKRNRNEVQQDDTSPCMLCHECGDLIICDGCENNYHLTCVGLEKLPKGNWYCTDCQSRKKHVRL